jgi:23S rRNA (uracil1939-C5)-methyltransferase
LPGEEVRVQVIKRKNSWEQATMTAMRHESAQRVKPKCPHFGVCGGCKMQHFHPAAQVAVKQRVLENNLWHLGKVKPDLLLRPIEGPAWGYRFRARLSVHYLAKRQTVLVGFHERKSSLVAEITSCDILPAFLSRLIAPLRELIYGMSHPDRIPQIEVAVGTRVTVLVLRHLLPLSAADLRRLKDFAQAHSPAEGGQATLSWWLQPQGPDSAHPLDAAKPTLDYVLPEFGITMPFKPTDFTQVNHGINEVLVGRALHLLDTQKSDRVIDWFCGLGNFTLPLATQAREVLGIEGSEALVARSRENAVVNGVAGHTRFLARNLFEITPKELASHGYADRWLIDPPRDGAFALVKALVDLHLDPSLAPDWVPPQRIVYVSCNPSTLARDAGLLVHQGGYRCVSAGAVNMFPHTAHVESMAVFERISG